MAGPIPFTPIINGANVTINRLSDSGATGEETWGYNASINTDKYTISGNNVVWNDGTILQYNGVDVLPTANIIGGGEYTTRAASSKLSVDLTTLSGWANLTPGNHTIKIVAKGTGYRDSELSAGVVVSKAAGTVTLEKGTYKWVDEPNFNNAPKSTLFNFVDAGGSSFFGVGVTSSFDGFMNYFTNSEGTSWTTVTAVDPVYWQNNNYKTITLSTDQQVSAEFYKWAITDGNLVKYEETYLLNTTLSMPSTATYYGLEGGYKIGDSIYDSICIGYNNGKELRIAWRDDDSGDLMWNTLYNSNGWLKQSNRGLTLLKEPAPAFLTWLQANSTQPV